MESICGIWITKLFEWNYKHRRKIATQSQSKFDCLVEKEEHEQTINTEHYKNELCINFRRKIW